MSAWDESWSDDKCAALGKTFMDAGLTLWDFYAARNPGVTRPPGHEEPAVFDWEDFPTTSSFLSMAGSLRSGQHE